MRIPYISLIAAGALTLGGCAYGDLGYGVGLGYGGGYYDSPYYGPYGGYGAYPGYYGGFGAPYFGWYDDYYYPGTGVFVYDSYRRPHRWSSRERDYWMSRQSSGTHTTNWSGFSRHSDRNPAIVSTWHENGRHHTQ
jgi:hypothetical protein